VLLKTALLSMIVDDICWHCANVATNCAFFLTVQCYVCIVMYFCESNGYGPLDIDLNSVKLLLL